MQDYRAYIMGPNGHVQNRVDLRCNDESEAIRLARQLVDGHDVELWQLDRKIETFRRTSNLGAPTLEPVGHDRLRPMISDSA
jgi:hypothetical protein